MEYIIGFLFAFITIREWMNWKERHELCKKLMAKNYIEYASFDASCACKSKKKEEKEEKKIPL
jgi:hypothetical protein